MKMHMAAASRKLEEQQEIEALDLNPLDADAQAKISERIRLSNVQNSMEIAIEVCLRHYRVSRCCTYRAHWTRRKKGVWRFWIKVDYHVVDTFDCNAYVTTWRDTERRYVMNRKHLIIFMAKSIHVRHGSKLGELKVTGVLIGGCRNKRAEVKRKAICWHKGGMY